MSCKYIEDCPSASGWCFARNEPKGDCAGFLITAYQNLKEDMESWVDELNELCERIRGDRI